MTHELRIMQANGTGSVINLTSVFGNKGAANSALYVGSKHAIIGATCSAALEAAPHGVRVNAIGPGPVQTAMFDRVTVNDEGKAMLLSTVPLGRPGNPEEIGETAVYLASSAAGFVTGQVIYADGGMSA